MKLVFALAFTLVAATQGCGTDDTANRAGAEEVARESTEAIEAAKDYLSEEKQRFIWNSEHNIAELDEKTKAWKAKGQDLSADAQAAARKELAEIETKAADARKQLNALKKATEEAGGDLRKGAEAALDDLHEAYGLAASRFQEDS